MPAPIPNPLGRGAPDAEVTDQISNWLKEREDPEFVPEAPKADPRPTRPSLKPADEANQEPTPQVEPEPEPKAEPEAEPEPEAPVEAEVVEADPEHPQEAESEADAEPLSTSLDEMASKANMSVDDLLDAIHIDTMVDGELKTVNLREARDGYQRETDYRNKTHATGEERRAVEAERATLSQERTHYAQQLYPLIQRLNAEITDDYAELDRLLADEDHAEANFKRREIEKKKESRDLADREAYQIAQRGQAEATASMQRTVVEQEKALAVAHPEWDKDSKLAHNSIIKIREYAKTQNVPADDADNMVMAPHLLICEKAMKYDALMAAKPGIKKKAASVPKVVTPGAAAEREKGKPGEKRVMAAKTRLAKTGKIGDLANVISAMGLGDKRRA